MVTDHDKQATGNRETANEMTKEDPTQGITVWLQPFTKNLEDLEAQCSHIPLKERTHIRKAMLQKWGHKHGSLLPQNPKRDLFCEQKSMVPLTTAEHKVLNGGRQSWNNHRYAVVVQVLATQWNLCQSKISHKRQRRIHESLQKPS